MRSVGGPPLIDFGREICSDLAACERREWLVTNGIGGYALGTVAGTLTRRYHGLLIAALKPPVGRTLLATKLDATAAYDGRHYRLYANRWRTGVVDGEGPTHLERFHLDGSIPTWTYALADALLEVRIFMQPLANTTYVRYALLRGSTALDLSLSALVNYREHHGMTQGGSWRMEVLRVPNGLRVGPFWGATPFYILSARARADALHDWYRDFHLADELERGLDAQEDHLAVCRFTASLKPGETVTIAISTDPASPLDGDAALQARQAHDAALLEAAHAENEPDWIRQLVLAADQFVVRRSTPHEPEGRSVMAGYPWFSDWGRDTFISLPGLLLATGRAQEADRLLRTYAEFVDQGMVPNLFPEAGAEPEFNTADATLWYIEAIRATVGATGDLSLARDLYPVLRDIIDWHVRGTRHGIGVDPADGLLRAGVPGLQLTWMDIKVGDWVVTPRIGKAVEINALWYNALVSLAKLAQRLDQPDPALSEMANRVRQGFERFWNAGRGYLYDVLDGPQGDDATLRPNQLLAVSLPHSPLPPERQRAVVDRCSKRLLTSVGLRTLDMENAAYAGHYGGDVEHRDSAYHQGTVWAWLIGPFVAAHLRVYGDPAAARAFLLPFRHHLRDAGLGTISEIFDGDPPFVPRGAVAQAWSVGEVLRAWRLTASVGAGGPQAAAHEALSSF